MYEIIAVTNRKLCERDFLEQVKRLAGLPLRGIILREKDLPEEGYKELLKEVLYIMEGEAEKKEGFFPTYLIVHTYKDIWMELYGGSKIKLGLHLPLPLVKELGREGIEDIKRTVRPGDFTGFMLGTSVHNSSEAVFAEDSGINYLIAGHVFETDCKRGIPGRGTDFIKRVCQKTMIPVYGIGGISAENAGMVRRAGARGVCLMSQFMKQEIFSGSWLKALGGA